MLQCVQISGKQLNAPCRLRAERDSRRDVTLTPAHCPCAPTQPSNSNFLLPNLSTKNQIGASRVTLPTCFKIPHRSVPCPCSVCCVPRLPLLSYSIVLYDRSTLFSTWRCTQGSAANWIPRIPVCPLTDHTRAVSRVCERLVLGWGTQLSLPSKTFHSPHPPQLLFSSRNSIINRPNHDQPFLPPFRHVPPRDWAGASAE